MQKGFAPILIVVIVAVLGIGGYFVYRSSSLRGGSETTDVAISPTPSPSGAGETANWKTYTNIEYKISFKYPPNFLIVTEEKSSDTYDVFFARSELEKQRVKDCLQQMECYSYPFAIRFKVISKPSNKTLNDVIWDDSRADPKNFSPSYVDNFPSLQEQISGVNESIVYHTYVDRSQTVFHIQIDRAKDLEKNVNQILATFKFTQ